ncbi:MAG: FkbM family methyltransferase [Sedimentisphaerales bacterium]|nr:FkbM family methyltransferase [Sedimentisphaerales bacterium]
MNVLDALFRPKKAKRNKPFEVQKRLFRGNTDLVIFDVGAYVGEIAAKYEQIFPKSTIYCFEPFPDSFQKLNQLCRDASIKTHQIAFSDKEGKATFHTNVDLSCNSLLPPTESEFKCYSAKSIKNGEIQVETNTIDNFCAEAGISGIDILKLDVEGAEMKVFEGASSMLSKQAIKLIYSEVMFIPHYTEGCLFHELTAFLNKHGYTLFNLYHLKSARNGQLRWGNAIFLSSEIRARIKDPSAV